MVGKVFRNTNGSRHWAIEMGRKQYLANTGKVIEFTGYAHSFPNKQVPKAGEVGSIWYELENEAQMALINYRASLEPIEEPVWVNI